MLTAGEADELAHHWIEAWNDHDLERILAHYADDVVFRLPSFRRSGRALQAPSSGGTPCLRTSRPPSPGIATLTFRLTRRVRGIDSVTPFYESVERFAGDGTMI